MDNKEILKNYLTLGYREFTITGFKKDESNSSHYNVETNIGLNLYYDGQNFMMDRSVVSSSFSNYVKMQLGLYFITMSENIKVVSKIVKSLKYD